MGERGPKPKGKVKIRWSPNFAYAIGLLVSDGNLSPDGRHIVFVSKDREQLLNFTKALDIHVAITDVVSIDNLVKRIQFGDVLFYQFLLDIGLMANKSKILGEIKIPGEYFLISCAALLMGMVLPIRILIRAGGQALCSTQRLFPRVENISSGYKKRSIAGSI
jgi:hypothetical protein